MTVAVLFAMPDSVYREMPGCQVYDIERDARSFDGGAPVIAHPPCRAWSRMRAFARPPSDEYALALLAVARVRECGGVLEHPEGSSLWPFMGLPKPGDPPDLAGGWTTCVDQWLFGHPARKRTLLYVVGVRPADMPPVPWRIGRAAAVVGQNRRGPGQLPEIAKRDRSATPPEFARYLLSVAQSVVSH